MEGIMKIVLPGRPITKKNHQDAFPLKALIAPKSRVYCPKCHSPLKILFNLLQSKQYREYEKACLWVLKASFKGSRIESKVAIRCLYYLPNKRGAPDLVGLIQATQDILQKAKVISDDQNVISLDGSRIAGYDKENPRAEIEIEAVEEGLF
jgi:Holliday junction resolvase RusA-like endonuclease